MQSKHEVTQQDLPKIASSDEDSQVHAPTMEHGVLNIDMRQNPDIFGAQLSSSPVPVQQLAQMAGNGCAGHANVVVKEENGRLFVRFKLPVEHAHLFPESQGFDESRFTTSPSAVSSSPRINFNVQTQAEHTPTSIPEDWLEFGDSSKTRKTYARKTPRMADSSTLQQTPIVNHTPTAQGTPATETPVVQTPEVSLLNDDASPMFGDLTASAKPLSPLEGTPLRQEIIETPSKKATANTPSGKPQHPTVANTPPASTGSAVLDEAPVNNTPTEPTSTSSSTPTTSFTPVNRTSPRNKAATPSGDSATKKSPTTKTATPPAESDPVPSVTIKQQVYDDSPGRDYMRDFIKRSRRTSTTETGSPMAPVNKRQPLVAKSPNTPSPLKKRKLEKGDDAPSPLENAKEPKETKDSREAKEPMEPAPKRVRRTIKAPKQKAELDNDVADELAPTQKAAVEQSAHDDDQDELSLDHNPDDGPATRRSSRLRTQTRGSSGPRSSIPTSIKIGPSGAGRGTVLNSTVRNDQQELTSQTRMNTKKNKGNAEYPAQVLARVAESAKSDESDASAERNWWLCGSPRRLWID